MGRVAYLFPGQGSQSVGMGLAFRGMSAGAADVFSRADHALGFDLQGLIASGPADVLAQTEHTQPAILTTSIAIWRAAVEAGLPPPDFVAGHSLGEYSALVAAGSLQLEDAVRLVRDRGRYMQEAVPAGVGAMAAVLMLPHSRVIEVCADVSAELPGRLVAPANINSPEQIVVAGHAEAVDAVATRCRASGARVLPLKVSAPFHSPLMTPARERLAARLPGVSLADARVPLVSNVDARPEVAGERLRSLLVEQVTAPVLWMEVINRLLGEGCDTFIELGPGSVLTGLVRRRAPQARALAVHDPEALAMAQEAFAA